MKKDFMKFATGVAVGVGSAVATQKYLASEHGQKTKQEVKKMFSQFYAFIYPKLKAMKDMTKAKYSQAIISGAKEFGKAKKMSDEMVQELIEKTTSMWDEFIDKDKK